MKHKSYAHGLNHWLLEPDLIHILKNYWKDLPEKEQVLIRFGELAGGRAYEIADHVDRSAAPTLVMHDLDGRRIDRVRLCPAHSQILGEMAFINEPPYRGRSWHEHFALGFLLADPGLYCTLIVTNQTAYPIYKYAPEHRDWLEPLLTGQAWGATWMTETQGGSDLGATETSADLDSDGWKLNGDTKFFASNAGLSDLAVVSARPAGARQGAKGIALFLVPRQRENGELNFHVRRLKDKLATRAVPTGEVEFLNSQAYLIGEAELGIYYTLETLTVSRLANAVGAMGLARKAHLESLFRTQTRVAFNKPLSQHPLIRRDLTDMAVRIAAGLCLVFHAIDRFDRAWKDTPPYSSDYHYARFLSHLAKNRTAEHAASVTALAMELFGGLGFMEECSVPRLHREALVTSIWEGSSNIQALDMLEVMQKKGAHEPFLDEFLPELEGVGSSAAMLARQAIEATLRAFSQYAQDEIQWFSKDALNRLADAAQVALLYKASTSGGERFARLAELYAHRFLSGEPYPAWVLSDPSIWWPMPEETS
jgi:acyl-CoA dehydrogenase